MVADKKCALIPGCRIIFVTYYGNAIKLKNLIVSSVTKHFSNPTNLVQFTTRSDDLQRRQIGPSSTAQATQRKQVATVIQMAIVTEVILLSITEHFSLIIAQFDGTN